MNDAGCPVRPEWIVSADFTIEGAYAAARQLLASAPERPTAVFAASDEMAIGTILAARDFGLRIPDDLSVMGIDGHDLGKVLGLTTIDQDAKGQGGHWLSGPCWVPSTTGWFWNPQTRSTPPPGWWCGQVPLCPDPAHPRTCS